MQHYKFTIGKDEKQISVPSNWGEVTLSTFQSIVSINQDLPAHEKKAIELSLLMGKKVSEIKELPFPVIEKIIEHTNTFLTVDGNFDAIEGFTHLGVNYVCPKWDYTEITFGEWMDAQTIINIKTEVENDNYENAHKLIAVLCRKEGITLYNSDEVELISEGFKTLPMSIVFSITSFFLQQKRAFVSSLGIFSTHLLRVVERVRNISPDLGTMGHLQTLLDMGDLLKSAYPQIQVSNEPTSESPLHT